MIKKIECFVAVCDVCEQLVDADAEMISHFDTEAQAAEMAIDDQDFGGSGCQVINGKLCCDKCWTYDDDGEVAIREKAG